eukprot:PITA_05467
MVSVDSWEYPTDFLIINPKTRLDGHSLILGRPWLATADAYIGCRQGNMTITKGPDIKNLVLYPPAQPSLPTIKTNQYPVSYLTNNIRSPLTVQKALDFKDQTEDDAINNFISQTESRSHTQCFMIEAAFDSELEEYSLKDPHDQTIPVTVVANSKVVEIEPGKTLNINANLTPDQEIKLLNLLQKYKEAFAWDYPDMKGIDPQLCTHHIYMEKDARPVRQPQRRLNPHLKEIVKAELQKLLDVNFIYPISDSKWVSPLVVVPKKNGKWRICVDYRELNKATQKDHFPLPFIDQVLDTLAGNNFFSFLDGFSGYNQIQIAPEDQDKTTFTCPWGTFAYRAFKELKKLVSTARVLRGPNWNLPFQISSDASDTAIGAVLGQEEDKKPYAIYYISKNLSFAELNYTVTEKEFLAVIHAVNKFGHYITGYPVVLYTDHSAIKYLANKPVTNARIIRWLILLQEFDITIKDRPGKENPVADFLSRIPKSIETAAVEDQFLDEHLFSVAVRTPWYADVANYLAVGKLPKHLTPQERKQIVQKSTRFSWIGGHLFHTGADMQIRRCIREDEIFDILKACHDGPCGGHFAEKRTTHKVLQIGYYWSTIFKDAKKICTSL